jgi:hypothetical protein
MQVKTQSKWTDIPFALHLERADQPKICLPSDEPEDKEIALSFGYFVQVCEKAGFELVPCTGPNQAEAWNSYGALKERIEGACACLLREVIAPAGNIPPNKKVGWDYALWYAFSSMSGETTANQFVTIDRCTNFITGAKAHAWNQGQFPSLKRLGDAIRVLASYSKARVAPPKRFLKKRGFFLERMVGKKPVIGLYTTAEFELAKKAWQDRRQHIETTYDGIEDNWPVVTNKKPLGSILERFTTRRSEQLKQIEDVKERRAPLLLVWAGKGKDRRQTLAKGDSLASKLLSVAPENPRAIAKVMWSPLDRLSQNEFIEATMGISEQAHRSRTSIVAAMQVYCNYLENNGRAEFIQKVRVCSPSVVECCGVYAELISVNNDFPAWFGFFGNPA